MYQMQRVYVVDVLLALIHLPLDPVPVEIPEEVVDVFGGNRITTPFFDIEGEQRLVGMRFGPGVELEQVLFEVLDQLVVQLFSEEMRYSSVRARKPAY